MRIIDKLISEIKKGNLLEKEALKKLKSAEKYIKNYAEDINEFKIRLRILKGKNE